MGRRAATGTLGAYENAWATRGRSAGKAGGLLGWLPLAGSMCIAIGYAVIVTYILKALAEFKGVGRRFQRYGEIPLAAGGSFTLVDDYGHHPAEMRATIAAARGAFPGRRQKEPPGSG